MRAQVLPALLSPLRGLWLLLTLPALWPYAMAPLLLGVGWSVVFLLQEMALPELPAGPQWYFRGLSWAAGAILWASVLWIQLLIAASAPLLDWLGEQTEEALGVLPKGPGFWRELLTLGFLRRTVVSLYEALRLLGFKLFLLLLAALLGLLPTVGPALAYVLSGLATGIDFIDYPLARRRLSLSQKLAWARTNWLATLAFGTAVFALLSVPVLAALLLPAGVVGGTELVFRLGGVSGEAEVRAREGGTG